MQTHSQMHSHEQHNGAIDTTEEADGKRSDRTTTSRRSAMQRRRFRRSQGNMSDFYCVPVVMENLDYVKKK